MRSLERVYHSILVQFSVKNQLNLYKIIGYKFRIQEEIIQHIYMRSKSNY